MLHIEWRRWSEGVRSEGREMRFSQVLQRVRGKPSFPPPGSIYFRFFFFLSAPLSIFSSREMHRWGQSFAISRKTHPSLSSWTRSRLSRRLRRSKTRRLPTAVRKGGKRTPCFQISKFTPGPPRRWVRIPSSLQCLPTLLLYGPFPETILPPLLRLRYLETGRHDPGQTMLSRRHIPPPPERLRKTKTRKSGWKTFRALEANGQDEGDRQRKTKCL